RGSPRSRRGRTLRARGSRRGSVGCRSLQSTEYSQPVPEKPRGEELLAHVLLARAAELLAELRLAKYLQRPLGALLGGGDEEAGLPVLHLQRDAAHVAA